MVPAESNLYLYCSAKDKDESRIFHPFVFWLKNDLNDDGDKIILLAPDKQPIASLLKVESTKSDFYGYKDNFNLSDAVNEQGLSTGITEDDKSGLQKIVTSFQNAPEELKKRTNKDLVKKVKKVPAKPKAKKTSELKPQDKDGKTDTIQTGTASPSSTTSASRVEIIKPPTSASMKTAAANAPPKKVGQISPPAPTKNKFISPSPWGPGVTITPPNANQW